MTNTALTSSALEPFLDTTLETTDLQGLGERYGGKVRDVYLQKDQKRRFLVATDRQSAFDINWTTIPLKGQVLTQISSWWFDQISDIMATQVIENPDPNVVVVKDLTMIPVEIVVRAYLTGSSKTAVWVNYKEGVRNYCGNTLPEGMVKNQKFDDIILTPTTKGEDDELIDANGIFEQGLSTPEQWAEIEEKAFAVFRRGQELAAQRGLILVDTKYEMGYDENGVLTIADEVHTPDSSRFWVENSYQERFDAGQEPESLDKEFFRLWLREQGFEYGDKSTWPEITDEVRVMLGTKYIELFEKVTGGTFVIPNDPDIPSRIVKNLEPYISK
ncbi:MAG: phosphoribosylaminoimidazolesuccinocarboxamide synthase [Candidatus Peribacter sp.]|jgi:phosphoribosylaminoimidazole-succinocarboxamide synthase|nr:phosphoribosylaminoimidazolesuccinocarboxamide synthase [Candidatus Peribacter sp.]MBT4392580.1 phosphoribosylaminoimidazolesuccinocarboxamide synthase [Candidatus Peribacter sp.]MBT4601435.1 phosphoribosylaminoimidazolesuccinocarboxamide synthase [Candidatus Peribacter sp.]MBT5149100.1 phosphoribosylaminoimidazolesuccinocarboxamide synthase [Candidatus Peribacter sp.]MBT5638125.1 phosphoribosylaminoimidazolesuccinocarboxamide synthase [Candidatus Peribacter sp.]